MKEEEFARIAERMHDEMFKAGADTMDYYNLIKMQASIILVELYSRGADDEKISEAIDMMTDSMRTDLHNAWADIKNQCIINHESNNLN